MSLAAETVLRVLGLVSFAAAAGAMWWPRASRRVVVGLSVAGTFLVLAAGVLRWSFIGHPPLFGTWENTTTSAFAVSLAVLLGLRTHAEGGFPLWLRLLAVWPPATLLFGSFFRAAPLPLTISERSWWVDVHVAFAWLAYSLLLSATMRSIAGMVEGEDAAIDDAVLRSAGLGFVAFSLMLAVGSWYSYRLFAEWYQWEIVETFAAATWLGYGAVLHARLLLGWRGPKLYRSMAAVLPLLLMSFWVWSLWSGTYHFFDITVIRAR